MPLQLFLCPVYTSYDLLAAAANKPFRSLSNGLVGTFSELNKDLRKQKTLRPVFIGAEYQLYCGLTS